MSAPVRVLLVDDSAFVRRATERMLAPLDDVEVVGFAADGEEAVRQVCALRPDLVIMDVEMPGLDGVRATERIMAECPTAVLLLSSHTREGTDVTLRALEAGAVDFLDKSGAGTAMDIHALAPLLRAKVRAVMRSGRAPGSASLPDPGRDAPEPPLLAPTPVRCEVVVVGASTGGPRALAELVPALPAGFAAGVLVAQHMPAGFTGTLAERLDRRSALRVREAADGDPVRPGEVLIAPGGWQMVLERGPAGLRVRVRDVPGQLHRPSVNLLLESAARVAGPRAVGVVLTGMGNDGADGLARLRAAGGRTLVEAQSTAVIDGMPGAARGAAERSVPLGRMARALSDLCGKSDGPRPGN